MVSCGIKRAGLRSSCRPTEVREASPSIFNGQPEAEGRHDGGHTVRGMDSHWMGHSFHVNQEELAHSGLCT